MQTAQHPSAHYSIQDDGVLLRVIVPVPKNEFMIFALGLFLVFWVFAEVRILTRELFTLIDQGPVMWIWLLALTATGLEVIKAFFWHMGGKEVIEIRPELIKTKWVAFGFGGAKEYVATKVGNLRISPPAEMSKFTWRKDPNYWSSVGTISFDYDWQTIRFGRGIEEAEAKEIIGRVLERFPKYGVPK